MSIELLSKANRLNNKLEMLRKNKKTLSLCLSTSFLERESYLEFYPTSRRDEPISIPLEEDEFKRVSFLLNEMNEKKLLDAENEFYKIFNHPKQ